MLRGAALLALAQLATAFREVSDPSRPCSERNGCQSCLDLNGPTQRRELCTWCAVRTVEQVRADRLLGVESARRQPGAVARGPSNLRPENLRVALGLDVMSTQPQYDDAAYLARVASAAPTAPVPATVVMGGPVTAPVPTTVVMGGPVTAPVPVDATPEVIPAARVATDTDAPPPYAVVVGRALSGTGPAAMM